MRLWWRMVDGNGRFVNHEESRMEIWYLARSDRVFFSGIGLKVLGWVVGWYLEFREISCWFVDRGKLPTCYFLLKCQSNIVHSSLSLGDVDGRFSRAKQDELSVFRTLFDENDLMRSIKSGSSTESFLVELFTSPPWRKQSCPFGFFGCDGCSMN